MAVKFKIPTIPSTVNKTIRFPSDLVNEVEKLIQGQNCTFSAFVIAAVRAAAQSAQEQKIACDRNSSFQRHHGKS